MSSYIESALIIGLPIEQLFKSQEKLHHFENFKIDKYDRKQGLGQYGAEFDESFEHTFYGYKIEKNNTQFALVMDLDYFEKNKKIIERKIELFKDLFGKEPKIISTYYRY